MPTFDFEGRNKEGKLITGKRMAQSSDTLGIQLLSEGILPVLIKEEIKTVSVTQNIKDFFRNGRITVDQLGIFSRQMHTLTKTGVPITVALKQLADNTRNLQMVHALYGIVEHLESGQDLAASMQHYPEIFTPIMIGMIRVGQNTGHLDEAFLRLNQYLELEASALKRVKTALRYPTLVLISVIVAIVLINIFVIPTFAKVFSQVNIELPALTVFLINLSDFFMAYWVYMLVAVVAMVVGVYRYLHTESGKLAWHRNQLKIPIIGKILKRTMLLRFAQSFAVVIRSGISLTEGMDLVANSMHNEYARRQIVAMREAVEHGKSLTQAAAITALFTPLELQMLSVSEETGELDKMLEEVASFYRREVDYDLKRLGDLIEPILIVLLSGVILVIAFAVYLPIWNMIKLVHS